MMRTGERRAKHVPERSCIACRRKRAKWELIRIVRTEDGGVEIDPRGRRAGRGAYLCKQRGCWEAGLQKKRIEHALRSPITADRLEDLLAMRAALVNGQDRGTFGEVKACDKELVDDSAD